MKSWLKNIGINKWMHIAACFIIACIMALVDYFEWGRPCITAACVGATVAFFVGLLKEIVWNCLLGHGSFRIGNIAADLMGALAGFFYIWWAMSLCNNL